MNNRWVALAAAPMLAVLVAGCSTSHPAHVPGPATSASTSSAPSAPAAPTGPAPTGHAAPPLGLSGRPLPGGGPVPAGFEPASVTFTSPTLGYVLGTTSRCASPPCTSVLRTLDGGAHWVGLPAPRAALTLVETASSATTANVSRIRFADPSNGWAYGPGLWATHDGARSWHQVPIAGRVISLEAAAGQADLVASPCQPGTPCPGIALLQSPAGSDSFVPVARQSTAGRDIGALALHPPAGFAALGATAASSGLGGPTTVQATADTHTWRPFPDPCRVTQQLSLSSVAAADARTLFTLCSGEGAAGSTAKQVVATTDGRSAVVGAPSRVGDGGQLAAATSSTLLLAASSAASWLERSTDGGRHWATVTQYNDGGAGFVDLGFTTASQGVVIHGKPETATTQPGQVDELLATRDAGSTWHHVTFTS